MNHLILIQEHYNKVQKEVEKDLKILYAEVNLKKNEVNDLRSNYDRKSQEYKDLTIVFKQLQVEEKTLCEIVGLHSITILPSRGFIDSVLSDVT